MGEPVRYQRQDSVATVTLDDGKVNALSLPMLQAINDALDRAQADGATVVITGRPGVFSAGFDLQVLRAGGEESDAMVRGGFELALRLLGFPTPVVAACNGHAIAMAAFLLLSADYRVGVAGPYKLTANEVALGITLPRAATEICRSRLTPAHLHRVAVLAEVFAPGDAAEAGFLDRVVGEAELAGAANEAAVRLAGLPPGAYMATKLRVREGTLAAVRADIDRGDLLAGAG
jgi:enoyl-CoA hydratase